MDSVFVVMFYGDLPVISRGKDKLDRPYAFYSLDAAKYFLDKLFCRRVEVVEADGYTEYPDAPDPEDDRIVIYEANPMTNEVKPVWAFNGWHWSGDEAGELEQGTLPSIEPKSLYEIAMNE